jgi:hypothetical protein
MRPSLFLLLAALLAPAAHSQDYRSLATEAAAFAQTKDHEKSVAANERAFKSDDGKNGADFYQGACEAALAGKPDLALDWLQKAADLGWANPQHLQADADLISLHELPRWTAIVATIKSKRQALDANIDKPLRAELRLILEEDQKYRKQLIEIQKKSGPDTPEIHGLWKIIGQKDAENLAKVEAILDTRGWLGPDIVGNDGASALFLVIQHANLPTQQKYLPMMRAAVKAGKAQGNSLALLEDRVALGEGRRQTYGSQLAFDPKQKKYYVSPLADPDNVDARRVAVGLPPLAEYVKNWALVWDVADYKKHLAEYEKLERGEH